LLLTTFPLMGICLFFTGFSFFIQGDQARLGCVATGIYLFMVVYSPGAGPVPFTYSAEAFVSLHFILWTRSADLIPASLHPRCRYVIRDSYVLGIQLHTLTHLACTR
jgi:hypothetical protein